MVKTAKVIYEVVSEVITGILTVGGIVGGGVIWYMVQSGHIVVTNLTKHITVITITY